MYAASLTLHDFVERYTRATDAGMSERATAQSHFIDLCATIGKKTPLEEDPAGEWYAFEKGVDKLGGGKGFADVWRKSCFAWEYKRGNGDLAQAYVQLSRYREALLNPPLLVTCDLRRFQVHTNFTDSVKRTYDFTLTDLVRNDATETCARRPREVLDCLFDAPQQLRPDRTAEQVTREVAERFSRLAVSLQRRGHDPHETARFLIRVLFCLFAEDIGLLRSGLFTETVTTLQDSPEEFAQSLSMLFASMANGKPFGPVRVKHFNGGLFTDDTVLPMTPDDMAILRDVAAKDWRDIEPSIFGTLFERGLDPDKRSQLGAHYTGRADILEIVRPVIIAPLRRRWQEVKQEAEVLIERRERARANLRLDVSARDQTAARREVTAADNRLRALLQGFTRKIAAVRVLDPAAGSGNFLYVALRELLDLEKEVITCASGCGLTGFFPTVSPEQMRGIEINSYAHELAPVTVWIGYIQWLHENGFGQPGEPILRSMEMFEHRDALLNGRGERAAEASWPEAEYIVGNPPFVGGNKIRQEFRDDEYVDTLFRVYGGRVPAFSDLVCYWFEKARAAIQEGRTQRAGLLATQAIRGGVNRRVLERIRESGNIFFAVSDREWTLEGALVHTSMVGFDAGEEPEKWLDGAPVTSIHADLTASVDVTQAASLSANSSLCFMGPSAKAPFDIGADVARRMLDAPANVNGRPNADVVRPVASAIDLTQRSRGKYTIDFGMMPLERAAEYELPFEHVRRVVLPVRQAGDRRDDYNGQWWRYARPRVEMREAVAGKSRYIATPGVAKHRLFVWMTPDVLCNQGTLVFARDDDYFFGVLHSRVHECWARAKGTQLREAESGCRYTPTSTFETFPFPWSPGSEDPQNPHVLAIGDAARDLHEKRSRWLNPKGVKPAELRKRTLTNLYNARPAWLDIAHRKLDEVVLAAYGMPAEVPDEAILAYLLELNQLRSRQGEVEDQRRRLTRLAPSDSFPQTAV